MILDLLFDDPAPRPRPRCEILIGDNRETLRTLAAGSVQCCVTSPPYFGLRNYQGGAAEIGKEKTPAEFVAALVDVFREVRRVLRDDGTVWLNLGDSYSRTGGTDRTPSSTAKVGNTKRTMEQIEDRTQKAPEGLGDKQLLGIPWRVAFALQEDGWILRQDIIWAKGNPLPESVKDRCTKSHEYLFLLAKQPRYFFNSEAMQEPAICGSRGSEFHTGKTGSHQLGRSQKVRPSATKGSFNGKTEDMAATGQNSFRAVRETRNRRSVWNINTKPYKGAHFATFPPELVTPCILAGSRPGDLVLDCFGGSGTTGQVALQHGRRAVLCELNPDYLPLIERRIES